MSVKVTANVMVKRVMNGCSKTDRFLDGETVRNVRHGFKDADVKTLDNGDL